MAAAKEARSILAEPSGLEYLYAFGPFRLDPQRRHLTRSGRSVMLPAKVFDTLVALVESAGHPVDNRTLMARIWPGAEVEDSLLKFNVSQVSMALGEGYIETLAPLGYRFVADLEKTPVAAAPEASPPVFGKLLWACVAIGAAAVGVTAFRWFQNPAPAAPVVQIRSLAVAPFQASSPEDQMLGAGIMEGLLPRFHAVPDLAVRAISPAGGPKDPLQAGRQLKVDAVLHGSIQHTDGRVKVVARLSRPAGGAVIAAESFEAPFSEVYALEPRIWKRMTGAVGVKLAPARELELSQPGTLNPEAYRLYSEAQYHRKYSAGEIRLAIEKLEKAISLDSRYASAHAALAEAYSLTTHFGFASPEAAMPKAKAAARRAIELNDRLAEAHLALANINLFYDWDVAAAEREVRRAIELARSSTDAHDLNAALMIVRGKFPEAIAERKRAQELDPLSPRTRLGVAWAYYYARDWENAIEENRRVLEEEPAFPAAVLNLASSLKFKGQDKEAFEQYIKADEMAGAKPEMLDRLKQAYADGGFKSYWRRKLGLRKRANPLGTAFLYVQAGRPKSAFRWLERAYERRMPELVFLHVTPAADPLRDDPRFQELVKRIGVAR
ncbi:MAG: winged helix-turn-helix domain-containing protein [Bryobacteraceae bacterium]|nr:winged helix-turn-helix domain-containing protein [Bryobacteraceae bacterium]